MNYVDVSGKELDLIFEELRTKYGDRDISSEEVAYYKKELKDKMCSVVMENCAHQRIKCMCYIDVKKQKFTNQVTFLYHQSDIHGPYDQDAAWFSPQRFFTASLTT